MQLFIFPIVSVAYVESTQQHVFFYEIICVLCIICRIYLCSSLNADETDQ